MKKNERIARLDGLIRRLLVSNRELGSVLRRIAYYDLDNNDPLSPGVMRQWARKGLGTQEMEKRGLIVSLEKRIEQLETKIADLEARIATLELYPRIVGGPRMSGVRFTTKCTCETTIPCALHQAALCG